MDTIYCVTEEFINDNYIQEISVDPSRFMKKIRRELKTLNRKGSDARKIFKNELENLGFDADNIDRDIANIVKRRIDKIKRYAQEELDKRLSNETKKLVYELKDYIDDMVTSIDMEGLGMGVVITVQMMAYALASYSIVYLLLLSFGAGWSQAGIASSIICYFIISPIVGELGKKYAIEENVSAEFMVIYNAMRTMYFSMISPFSLGVTILIDIFNVLFDYILNFTQIYFKKRGGENTGFSLAVIAHTMWNILYDIFQLNR